MLKCTAEKCVYEFISDLLCSFKEISCVKDGRFVSPVWNIKELLQNHLINNYGLEDQFEFRVHTLEKGIEI